MCDNVRGKAQTIEQKITREVEIAKGFKEYPNVKKFNPAEADSYKDIFPSKLFDLKCKYYEKNQKEGVEDKFYHDTQGDGEGEDAEADTKIIT